MTTNNEKCATVLTQHWHRFALSAQIRICYTKDAQKHIKTESCCEQTPVLGVCFLHREKKRRSIFEHIQQPAAASATEEKSGALALCRMARRQHSAASGSAGFGHDDLGKSDGDYEGRLPADSSHLHNRRYQDVEIGGGRITGREFTPEHPGGIDFCMYHADQYAQPKGDYSKVYSADDAAWYKQYAADTVERKPYQAEDGKITYHEKIVQKLPNPPQRKDRM